MGCAASKSLHHTVVPESSISKEPESKSSVAPVAPSAETVSATLLPPVETSSRPLKPIAFEIPLDRDVLIFSKQGSHRIGHHGLPRVLPKLDRLKHRPSKDTRKVGDYLDKLFDETPRESKLKLESISSYHTKVTPSDAHTMAPLRQRLLEKEAQVAANRAKEIEKLQAKLARQEEHARRVQERKKAMEKLLLEGGDFAAFKRNEHNEEYIQRAAEAVAAAAEAVSKSMEEAGQPLQPRRMGGTLSSTAGTGFRSTKNPGGQIIVGGKGSRNKYKPASSDADSALGSSVATSVQSSRGGSGRSESHIKEHVPVA